MAELQLLAECLRDERLTSGVAVASAALLIYDWSLTSKDELKFMWRFDRITYVRTLFFFARYAGLACAILDVLPMTVSRANIVTCLRLVTVLAAECVCYSCLIGGYELIRRIVVLATRTWAAWERSRTILILLVGFLFICVTPAAVVIVKDIVTTTWSPPLGAIGPSLPECRILISDVLVLCLTTYKVVQFYRAIPKSVRHRVPLLDVLWKDGVIYFVFMVCLGVLNIGLVFGVAGPDIRSGGTQLQMVIHSMLATRIVLHLSSTTAKDVALFGSSISTRRRYLASMTLVIDIRGDEEMCAVGEIELDADTLNL
ncbi:hypothetical protein FA95DRAFT_161406 [Auriscalpium vulgare]|uniref:Uncharacterized protein n=1 Tax=Auriscalpium vulgare TaxID=40419 RepID=A0ACB8RNA9_9AGAM|nr:hypothetical protein FA95DRAFT_161406 [Auriscalpium vulgare]